MPVLLVPWTWSAEPTGIAVVNGSPLVRLPVTCPDGPMVTARTEPVPTSARNWV